MEKKTQKKSEPQLPAARARLPHSLSLSFVLSDLGAFSSKARGGVSVREGQGVVLMCVPPPHSPGTVVTLPFV